MNSKLAILTLDNKYIWTIDSYFTHLKGWWNPPKFVTEFWSSGCKFYFSSAQDYEKKKSIILDSYEKSIKSFWSLMVL